MTPAEWIASKEVVVCSGPGGVGKTTTSAALAVAEARRGRKVLVLTIDPARRLANALGLERFESEVQRVPAEPFLERGGEFKGELYAMMLDVKAEWDGLMHRYAPEGTDPEKILNNRLYQYLSNNLAGAQEFMAMERLYHLHSEGNYDLVVLDTPPTKHALDFLEAPKKLFRFLEEGSFVRTFIDRQQGGMKWVRMGTSAVFKALERLIGGTVIEDISEFVTALEGYYDGFRERARKTNELLTSQKSLFILITAPTPLALSETRYFHQRLEEAGVPFGGFVFNRVHHHFLLGEKDRQFATGLFNEGERRKKLIADVEKDENLGPEWAELVADLAGNFSNLETLAEVEEKKMGALSDLLDKEQFVVRIPLLDQDIHDPGGIELINDHLFGRNGGA